MKTEEIVLENDQKTDQVGKKIDLGIDVSDVKKPEKKIEKELDNLLSGYKEVPAPDFLNPENNPFVSEQEPEQKPKRRRKKKTEPQIISGEIITGAMFLTLVDMFLPMLIGGVHNYLQPNNKISTHRMKMTQTQKKDLEPIVDEVMKGWEIKANPVAILVLSMISIYGVNYMELRAENR